MEREAAIREYGDASRLIDSIREETRRAVGAIQEQTERDVAQAERESAEEIRSFGDARRRETDAAIENAIYMMRNRAAIEKRKLRLNAVENFLRLMVDEAVSDYVKNNPAGYLAFLKKSAGAALAGMPGRDIKVHLRPGDAGIGNEMRDFIVGEQSWKGAVDFVADEALAMGGIILENRNEGILHNISMARLVSRKYDAIRKEAVKIVERHIRLE